MAQVQQASPSLTVGGYFEINRQLIPIVSYLAYTFGMHLNDFYINHLIDS